MRGVNLVVGQHTLRDVIADALSKSLARRSDAALALAVAVRAVLDADPTMGISEAYELVNALWVR